ncbi:UvrD-helicase domain-containing protein [Picosynechococcus sp. PCC 73109]|nr:ATP-dependent helicase [Picosynechococcus sp. PCC 73109]AMA10662.1 hypothetical protein AWQ23_14535 [Picosynechococcus sp. PCC 73109]
MITLQDFYRNYEKFRYLPNEEQKQALEAPPDQPLFVVAGPGTGKTTCLTLRILKLILVDGLAPESILATTFTKKAAEELRSRILGWGFLLLEELDRDPDLPDTTKAQLRKLDINQILTGTLDSLCEQILRDYREPGTQPPILIDEFVSKTLMLREGLFKDQRYRNGELEQFLLAFQNNNRFGFNTGKKNDYLLQLWDRQFQDQVDWESFLGSLEKPEVADTLREIMQDYRAALDEELMVDFAILEQTLLERLRENKIPEFTDKIQAVLVDEYQDSNLLQERIYFELSQVSQAALTVVGDDDQSLYRFRGATVELFSRFDERHHEFFEEMPKTVFLRTNYRSTENIIEFVNDYVTLDRQYQEVRVQSKPPLIAGGNAEQGLPILGMFRENLDELATDLADFIEKVFRGNGYRLPNGELIQCAEDGGDVGDCALLCSSPKEQKYNGDLRLPGLLREKFGDRLSVFNPRGQTLTEEPRVALLGGLLLEALDGDGLITENTRGLDNDSLTTFGNWRDEAIDYLRSPNASQSLKDFIDGWANRQTNPAWKRSVPVLDLIYAITHFFPEFYDDPEGQVFLEVFTRQLSASEQVSKFKGRVLWEPENPDLSNASVRALLRNFLSPIASGSVGVNEELMDTFPRDRLSIISIHQAKGLEFPLVIVDVGSEFKSNHHTQAFKRFPRQEGTPQIIENMVRTHTNLDTDTRSGGDRCFDDLYRQYFVAYSRPQEILLLVGLDSALPRSNRPIPNVALGWQRTGQSEWLDAFPFYSI